jgi:metal-dependent amidase/aminoacylase/carboxypeptidase family protein
MQKKRTAGLAADQLRAAGYEVTTGVGQTGVVGVLRNGDGPTVMLRADMDALPVEEATGWILLLITNSGALSRSTMDVGAGKK